MKRRVGVAQALLGNPTLLIVDEPTVGLDPQERVRFRNMLVDLAQERTIILSTHIIEDIAHTCAQLAVLYQGRLLFTGAVQDLIQTVQGKVWEIEATEYRPSADVILIATIQMPLTLEYRVLVEVPPHPSARCALPTLEDAYLWNIQHQTQ
jgi:ABC-type multidrug transport system ATPase subunit